MTPAVRVSLIIPTYNRPDLLTKAVNSALKSGVAGLEVVVVDDGSDDNTASALQVFGNRIVFVHKRTPACQPPAMPVYQPVRPSLLGLFGRRRRMASRGAEPPD